MLLPSVQRQRSWSLPLWVGLGEQGCLHGQLGSWLPVRALCSPSHLSPTSLGLLGFLDHNFWLPWLALWQNLLLESGRWLAWGRHLAVYGGGQSLALLQRGWGWLVGLVQPRLSFVSSSLHASMNVSSSWVQMWSDPAGGGCLSETWGNRVCMGNVSGMWLRSWMSLNEWVGV